jgi:outer membrane receptor protein involved in Fe transport
VAFAAVLFAAHAAAAAPGAVRQFSIPAEPVSAALIDFAVQANITIGGGPRCAGRVTGLNGVHTIEEGLRLLLAGTSCDFRVVAPDTVRIIARVQAPAKPASRPPSLAPTQTQPEVEAADIVVTATRRRAYADQLPYSVSVISGQEMSALGARDISDLTTTFAGVSTTNLGPGRDKILLRGLSDGSFTGRTQSTVGIYLDDTPVTYNAPDPDLRLVDLASVEVMRGPQGSLYGGGSMSGVYRIVTRKPELNILDAAMLAGVGWTQDGAPSNEAEAMLNVPLVKDRAAARLVAYDEFDGGYIDNVDLRDKNIDGVRRDGGRASLKVLLDPDWTLTTGVASQRITSDDTQYVTPSLGRLHRANAVREGSVNRFTDAFVTVQRDSTRFDFKAVTSLVQHGLSSQTDASKALPLFGGGSAAVGEYEEPNATTMVTEDAMLSSPSTGPIQWLVGVYGSATLEDIQSIVRTPNIGVGPAVDLYHEWRKDHRSAAAVYGEATWALSDRLSLTAGARATASEIHTTSLVEMPMAPAPRTFAGMLSGGGVSPKAALDYRVWSGTRVYALVSEGRRPGGFNTGGPIGVVFATSPVAPGMHRRFLSDELWNYEAGVKASFWDGRLRLRSAAFYDRWTNIQTDQYLNSGLSYTANAGDGRNIGLESELTTKPTDHLTIDLSAIFNNPELTRPQPGFISQPTAGLPGVPDVSGGGLIAYDQPLWSGWSARFSGQAQYIGRSHVTFDPTLAPTMGGYVIAQLSAQLIGPRWRASAFLQNPTGERGNTFSYGNPFDFRQINESTPQRPRTLRLNLAADF